MLDLQILFAVGSMFGIGASDFLYKRARSLGAVPASFLVIQAILFNASNTVAVIITRSLQVTWGTALFGIVEASLLYSAFTIFLSSLSSSDISTNAPIFRLNFVLTSLLAILTLGEALTLGAGVATALSAIAVLFFSRVKGTQRTNHRAFLWRILLATTLYGLSGYFYKLAVNSGSDPLSLITFQGFFFITFAVLTASARKELKFGGTILKHAPVCGILLSASSVLLVKSLALGSATISYPISQLSFVFTGLLGILVLKERLDLPKALGLIASVFAVLTFAGMIL